MTSENKAIAVERGCGRRVCGGIYLECPLSEDGLPLEAFLIDPPQLIDLDALGVTPVGVKLFERHGVCHVLDWCGSKGYPNVADFLEEVRRFGLSRRVAKNLDFSRLTPESRILILHARGYVENFDEYCAGWNFTRAAEAGHPQPRCPKRIVSHDQDAPPAMCAGLFWQDLHEGVPSTSSASGREAARQMPSFSYTASVRPAGVIPKYKPAIVASFPIGRLVAIHDSAATNAENRKRMATSKLPSAIERE